MADPRGYTRKEIESYYHPIQQHGIKTTTETLDAVNTQEARTFGDIASSVSFQTSGTLVVDVEVSVNGKDWVAAVSGVNNTTITTFNTHNVSAVRFTRTAGEGKAYLVGSI